MKKIYLLLLAMICLMGLGLSFNKVEAASESYELKFGADYNSKNVSSYSSEWAVTKDGRTFNIVNANNNNNGWSYIKMGSKNAASVGSITNAEPFASAVTSVVLTVDKVTTDVINGIYLQVASSVEGLESATKVSVTPAAGDITFDLSSNTISNGYYMISVDCAKASSNGPIQISKVTYTYESTACSHSGMEKVKDAVEATCTADGNIAYWKCPTCLKYFSDEAGTTEVKLEDTIIPAKRHNYVNGTCTGCGDVIVGTPEVLTATVLGIESGYTDFSNVKPSTGLAAYSGQISINNGNIQMRSSNENSGIVTSGSKGLAKKVTVEWASDTTDGRTINVYGKNTVYSTAEELYVEATQGTLIGTIVCGESTELVISDNYNYIGLRSNFGALYCETITINWLEDAAVVDSAKAAFATQTSQASLQLEGTIEEPTNVCARFGGIISAESFNGVAEYGVVVSASAITSLTADELATMKETNYAMSCNPVAVNGGFQFAWVIDNIPATHEAYEMTFNVYLYMLVDGQVVLTSVSNYSVNGIIDTYTAESYEGLTADVKAVLAGLKK